MSDLASHTTKAGDAEHAALFASCEPGVALCTIVGIEGSFSRRLGAQLAVHPDGSVTGSLSDGCLEQQLASDAHAATGPIVKRYGQGSEQVDFRLPCGGGLDILIDPAPDRLACGNTAWRLADREKTSLDLPANDFLDRRFYIPRLAIRAFGEGPELVALATIAAAADIALDVHDTGSLSLGRPANLPPADRWTAVVMLFHDHDWEVALLEQALESPAFYIGAQGGENARIARAMRLLGDGVSEESVARLRGPIGTISSCRTPQSLALSILSEAVGEYEKLQPHH